MSIADVFGSGNFDVEFDLKRTKYRYLLSYKDGEVLSESYTSKERDWLHRGSGGIGKLFAKELKKGGDYLDFQSPVNELAAVARRDSIQHPYFEPLYQWGKAIRFFPFGSSLGKELLTIMVKDKTQAQPFNDKETNRIVAVFSRAFDQHGQSFTDAVIADMAQIGYPLEGISLTHPKSINIGKALVFPGEPTFLSVKEIGLAAVTDQIDMSQGMFRALSVIIQLNYSQLVGSPSIILIDDIGEGLDFERSCALIELVVSKAKKLKTQLVMATNDRFVMNKVPLESWSVLQRTGGTVKVANYKNSKKIFDEFKFTGLSNFDFFAYDVLGGPKEQRTNGEHKQ
jgi:hypothetical protein